MGRYAGELIPAGDLPAYKGQRYEAEVPATLDLTEQAELALNGLAGTIDQNGDYQMWFFVFCNSRPPWMEHGGSDSACMPKYAISMPLMRLICGSNKHLDVEQGMQEVLTRWLAEDDGLWYTPYSPKRPWHVNWYGHAGYQEDREDAAQVLTMGAQMLAMMIRQQMDGDPVWDGRVQALARGLERIAVKQGDYAYYPDGGFGGAFVYPKSGWRKTGEPGGEHEGGEGSVLCYQGYQLRSLSLWAAKTGDEQALDFAGRLARFIMKPKFWGGLTDPVLINGQERGHVNSHFHARAIALRGLLEYGLVAGDAEACQFVRSSYDYMRALGIWEMGFIPTFPDASHAHYHYMEGCFIGDWVALGVKLSEGGYADCWEDTDCLIRNHLIEGQLADRSLVARVVANSPAYARP